MFSFSFFHADFTKLKVCQLLHQLLDVVLGKSLKLFAVILSPDKIFRTAIHLWKKIKCSCLNYFMLIKWMVSVHSDRHVLQQYN